MEKYRMRYITIPHYIEVALGDIKAKLFLMKVKDVLPMYYVAVRGRDEVPGAVQRVLNKRRISAIKEFILEGNMFFNTFILNWTDDNEKVELADGKLQIPVIASSAQVIDGQHRLEGLRQAYNTDQKIGEQSIIVVLTEMLRTEEAAKIFLNINTEQKPVPPSLIYDLFGEVNKDKDYYLVRAKDLVIRLHEDSESPYYRCIKLPGAVAGIGKVNLSTAVNALKQFTVPQGVFDEYNLKDFESQYKVLFNFFSALKKYYDEEDGWLKSNNPFMANSGCYAGIEFLCKEMVPKCAARKSFEQSVIEEFMPLDTVGLIYKEELKNKQGNEQRGIVYRQLKSAMLRDVPDNDEYKF